MENVILVEGRKFLWDGRRYESREQALVAGQSYAADGFETELREEQQSVLVYTRRPVAASAAEPAPGS